MHMTYVTLIFPECRFYIVISYVIYIIIVSLVS